MADRSLTTAVRRSDKRLPKLSQRKPLAGASPKFCQALLSFPALTVAKTSLHLSCTVQLASGTSSVPPSASVRGCGCTRGIAGLHGRSIAMLHGISSHVSPDAALRFQQSRPRCKYSTPDLYNCTRSRAFPAVLFVLVEPNPAAEGITSARR